MTNELRLPAPNDRILEEVRLKVALARQYLESLKEFGLTADWLNELETVCDRAGVLPTQEIPSTTAKETALDVCVQWGGSVVGNGPAIATRLGINRRSQR